MRVLVTGGSGFIGQHTWPRLNEAGHRAIVPTNNFNIVHPREVDNLMGDADAVIHLAGMLGTHELFDAPESAIDVNIKGTLYVLMSARLRGHHYVGITMPKVFPSVYTATKLGAEGLERAYHNQGVPVSRVRAFNAFGPGQARGHGHPQKIVPTFATCGWRNEPIPVWGDGEQTVDLIYADDLGRLLVECLQWGDDFTLDGGTGHPLTVNEVAGMVLDITGSRAGIQYLPMRRGEEPTKIVAAGEGWERLAWTPQFRFEDLERTVVSYKQS
jgi:UDP-glucose 4-epimerase